MARTSKSMLNESHKSGHPCLVPDLSRNFFRFSPLIMMSAMGLSYMAYIILRYVASRPNLWRFFVKRNGCWILSKAFSVSVVMILWFLFFSLLMRCIIMTDVGILKDLCIPGVNHS